MDLDHYVKLGALAIASRLRRLLYILQAEGARVYQDLNLDFRPKWFPVYHYVASHPGTSTTGVAVALGMAHPSVVTTVEELTSHGLVTMRVNKRDRRFRELRLSSKGQRILTELEPVWRAFADAGAELTTEGNNDFIGALSLLEAALERRSTYDRIMERTGQRRADRTRPDSKGKS